MCDLYEEAGEVFDVVHFLLSVIGCQLLVVGSRYDFLAKITRTDGFLLSVFCCLFSVFCFRLFGFKKNRTFFFKKPYHLYIILSEIANSN